MKIVLRIGQDEYVLCHGHERAVGNHMGPVFRQHANPTVADLQQRLRGTAITAVDRGNKTTRISWTIEVELASVTEAEIYALNYPQALPRAGKLRFVMRDENDVETVRELTNAVIEDAAIIAHEGVALTIQYTAVGGEIGNVTA